MMEAFDRFRAHSADFMRNSPTQQSISIQNEESPMIKRSRTASLVGNKTAQRAQLKADCKGIPITQLPATESAYKISGRGNVVSKISGLTTTFGQDYGK